MYLTGHQGIDKTIKEIASETVFDFETAKHYYLKTGDKDYCVELSRLHGKGYSSIALDLLADLFAQSKSKSLIDALQ